MENFIIRFARVQQYLVNHLALAHGNFKDNI